MGETQNSERRTQNGSPPSRLWRAAIALTSEFLVLSFLCFFTASAFASERYDPRLKFRTLSTPHFDVHFHQGEDSQARRLATIAEQVALELERTLGRPRARVHVILVNQDDAANGWATPFPINVIEIVAAAPSGASLIGNTSDWLRLVFTHEYTHILHLDRSRGLFGGLRRAFGRHPALMPNLFVPPWQIEGLATYVESAVTRNGRIPAGDFRLLLDRVTGAGEFASLDSASSVRVDWPSGNTPYLYGAYFHEYLAETYGESSLVRLADATAGRVPYLGSTAYKRIFNKSLGQLWSEFEEHSEAKPPAGAEPAARLTHHGFTVSAPTFSADGRLYYAVSTPHDFPAVMARDPDGTTRELTRRVGGGQLSANGNRIVFDQAEFVRSVAVQGDLFVADRHTGESQRLTREARAGDPDVSADGKTVVFTVQEADRRYLATLPLTATEQRPQPLLSEAETHYASPRWSPDGRYIAVERRETGGSSAIAIVDSTRRAIVRMISAPGSNRNVTPSWTRDGHGILFAAEGDEGPFRVYLGDIQSERIHRLANAAIGGQSPVQSPDGRTLVFVGLTAAGYDLFSVDWDRAHWIPTAESPAPTMSTRQIDTLTLDPAGPRAAEYNPWRTLVPRFWTPTVEIDDEVAIGGATSGADPLGRHAYALGAAWSTRVRPDWYVAYAYDRWRPTLFADISDETDPWRDGLVRSREINAGVTMPFRTFRRTQRMFGAFHASADEFVCAECDPPVDVTIRRRALRAGWSFTTARSYGFSISPEDGVTTSLSAEWSPEGLGSTGTASAAIADVRAFVPMVPRHGVVALRAAAASAWGDEGAVREFGAGGTGPLFAGTSFDPDAIGLIRGFDTADVAGRRAVVFNADYRVPLAWIERGVGTWPVSLRSVHGAVFADAGAAWNTRYRREARRASLGLELSADVVVGYVVPFTVASGVAWRHDPSGRADGAALFARIGRAF